MPDPTRTAAPRRRRTGPVGAVTALGLVAVVLTATPATTSTAAARASDASVAAPTTGAAALTTARLPLGNSALPEVRRSRRLASGVTWTAIRRGVKAAKPSAIATTAQGPWGVHVVTIDPRAARGRLAVTAGADLRRSERTSTLAKSTKALVAINGGFFTYTADRAAPGDPVGLGILRGTITSEPVAGSGAVGLIIDAQTARLTISRFSWAGTLQADGAEGDPLPVHGINRPPVAAGTCVRIPVAESGEDPPEPVNPGDVPPLASCAGTGEIVRVTGHWGALTPAGPGVEILVDRDGCVLRARSPRGGALAPAHVAYQGTGGAADALLELSRAGCLQFSERLVDQDGVEVGLTPSLNAVNGRQVLVRDGAIVETRAGRGFQGRNPRTIVGRTARGVIAFVTIDGRRPTSVGASLAEAARVARSLGLVDAINLDGGGSTTMVIRGTVVNQVSGRTERAVGDALVLLPG